MFHGEIERERERGRACECVCVRKRRRMCAMREWGRERGKVIERGRACKGGERGESGGESVCKM